MLSVLIQLLVVFAFLVFIGEPLRFVASKRLIMLSGLDLIEKCVLDVFLGGFILFILALLPFGLLSFSVILILILACFTVSLLLHRKALVNYAKAATKLDFYVKNRKNLFVYLTLILMFLVFISINLAALNSTVFGSVRDESIHSLYVQVMSENHFIPFTLEPYLPEAIVYPQASHVIFTFAHCITSLNVPETILYVSVLFKGLSIMGAYFLGKKLGKTKLYGLGLGFVFVFLSSWPLNVTWGANPFIVGFPLFLICLGLLYSLYQRFSYTELAVLGLLVGYSGALILSYFETFTLVSMIFFAYFLIKKPNGGVVNVLGRFGTVFLASLVPLVPFIYRYIYTYSYPNHNIGLPSDVAFISENKIFFSQSLQWALDNLSPYLLLKILFMVIIASFAILLLITDEYKKDNDRIILSNRFAIAIFSAALALSLVSFFLTPDMDVISWGHQGIILSIPLSILTLNFFVKFYEAIFNGKFDTLAQKLSVPHFDKGSKAALLASLTLLSLLVAPFVYYRFAADPSRLADNYNVYAVTTKGDYDLMLWMGENLSSNAVILVHPYEAGLFIPSVSHHKVIFPYTASYLSASYQRIVHMIANCTLNATTYQLMKDWNITHVYVGENVAYSNNTFPWWNPQLFIGNPNFELAKNFSNSYLFELAITNSQMSLYDDFQHANWSQNGWVSNQTGYGLGNASINEVAGSRQLVLKAQAAPSAFNWEPRYAYLIERPIFSENTTSVSLSFDLNVAGGFSGRDTFAVVVSDPEESKAIVLSTQDGVFHEYSVAAVISDSSDTLKFDLSRLWEQKYGSSLPETAVLQFITYDFDGNQNVVYLDNISVVAVPSA